MSGAADCPWCGWPTRTRPADLSDDRGHAAWCARVAVAETAAATPSPALNDTSRRVRPAAGSTTRCIGSPGAYR